MDHVNSGVVLEELPELEWSLWRAETRFDLAYMERVLAPDFLELGRSGRVWTREAILAVPWQDLDATLTDLAVAGVADGVALVTYVSEVRHDELERASRASLWRGDAGRWQLRFHQGTPLPLT
jgi:ribonuclease HI